MPGFRPAPDDGDDLAGAAKAAAVIALVVVGLVAVALALWKIRLVLALLLVAWMIAAAMRPGVERLARRRVPRSLGVVLHYAVLVGAVAAVLAFVVPPATSQVGQALGQLPTSSAAAGRAARHTTGLRRQLLLALQRRLDRLPTASQMLHPAISAGRKAIEVVVGVFFVLACSAYWVFEREQAVTTIASLFPRPRRRVIRQTWELIDLRLGAFVRGQLLMVLLVATALSLAFWLDGLPYWLLLAVFGGLFELVPVIGPLTVAAVATGVGATVSWPAAAGALIAVVAVRQIQDYFVTPRVIGGAVGLSPLLVLVAVASVGILLGPFYVLIAIPLTSAVATLVQVTVLGTRPEEVETPYVIFSPGDTES